MKKQKKPDIAETKDDLVDMLNQSVRKSNFSFFPKVWITGLMAKDLIGIIFGTCIYCIKRGERT
jgi:hypothetical protein